MVLPFTNDTIRHGTLPLSGQRRRHSRRQHQKNTLHVPGIKTLNLDVMMLLLLLSLANACLCAPCFIQVVQRVAVQNATMLY
jgi:hypothetical protein